MDTKVTERLVFSLAKYLHNHEKNILLEFWQWSMGNINEYHNERSDFRDIHYNLNRWKDFTFNDLINKIKNCNILEPQNDNEIICEIFSIIIAEYEIVKKEIYKRQKQNTISTLTNKIVELESKLKALYPEENTGILVDDQRWT